MITKTRKIIAISAATVALSLGAAVMLASNNNIFTLKGKADATVNSSFTFNYSDGYLGKSGSVARFSARSARGTELYMKSDNNYQNQINSTTKLIASFGSSSYASKYLSFYSDAECTNFYTFQKIDSIDVVVASTSAASTSYIVYTNADKTASINGTFSVGNNHIADVSGAKYIMLAPTSTGFLDILSVTINYTCDPSGEPEPEPATLESLSLSGGKKHFDVGNDFSFTGTATVHYSDGTSKSVSPIIKTAPNMSVAGLSSAILSYSENGVEVIAEYAVQVGVYEITYMELDMTTYEPTNLVNASISEASPSYAVPGATVSFTVVPNSGYAVADCVDMDEDVENFTISGNTVTFTMPSKDLEATIVLQPVIVSIFVDENAPVTQTIGSTFNQPTVYAIYGNGQSVALDNSDVTFDSTDYDMNTLGEYNVDVTYEDFSTTYTFEVVDEQEEGGTDQSLLNGNYDASYSSSVTCRFVFDGNGNGTYQRIYNGTVSQNYTMSFTYTIDSESKTVTLNIITTASSTYTYPNGWRLAAHTNDPDKATYTNTTGKVDSSGNFNVQLLRYANSTWSYDPAITFVKQA